MAIISIVVPVYKVPFEYLDACIDSIVNQTYRDFEVILVDDGSPKEWADKCDSYAEKDSRIRVLHKPNGGQSDARNKGVEQVRTEWVTFVDGDDWIEPDFIQLAVDRIQADAEPADLYLYSGFRNYPDKQIEGVPYFPDGTVFETYEERESVQTLCFTTHIAKNGNVKGITISSSCMKVFRVAYMRENQVLCPNVPYDEDSLFLLDSVEKAKKIQYVAVPVYHYRNTEGSAVNRFRPNAIHEQEMYWDFIQNFIRKNNKSEDFRAKSNMRVMTSMILLTKHYFFHPDNPDSFFKRQRACSKLFSQPPYSSAMKELNPKDMRKNARIKYYMLKMHLYALMEHFRKARAEKS